MEQARQAIEQIDASLLTLLEKRMDQVVTIGQYKKENNLPINDLNREEKLLEGLKDKVNNRDYWEAVEKVYQEIFKTSKTMQETLKDDLKEAVKGFQPETRSDLAAEELLQENAVAYFGAEGSYTHEAMGAYFPELLEGQGKGFSRFDEVVAAVVEGRCSYGILPIENSSTGSIHPVYDLLGKMPIQIVGEIKRPIEHYLMASRETDLEKLEVVYSHHQALSQCQSYLYQKGWPQRPVESSSHGAQLAAQNKKSAAIGSKMAAALHGLEILEGPINDYGLNQTRFIVFQRECHGDAPKSKDFSEAEKAARKAIGLSFRLKHESGTLVEVLTIFSKRQLNLLKIESRPIGERPFEYQFYLDFEGLMAEEVVQEALEEIKSKTTWLKVLGSWEKA